MPTGITLKYKSRTGPSNKELTKCIKVRVNLYKTSKQIL